MSVTVEGMTMRRLFAIALISSALIAPLRSQQAQAVDYILDNSAGEMALYSGGGYRSYVAPVAVNAEEQSNQTHSLSTTEESSQNEQTDKAHTEPKSKQDAWGGIVIAPIPISSPAIGSGAVLFGGYIFPLRRSDKTSPPSTVAGAVIITDNGTRGFALAGELFFKENSYHVTSGYFRGNINYDFYGVGLDAGTTAQKQPLKQDGQAFLGEFLYRPKWKFFLGPRLLAGKSLITLRTEVKGEVPPPPDTGIRTQLTGLGFRLNQSTRLNRFYPEQGTFLDFTAMFFSVALGSKYSFEPYRFTFNGYKV